MAEAGSVENDDPVGLPQDLGDAAGVVILARHHVAVNENDRAAFPTIAVMEANTIHVEEGSLSGVTLFRAARHDIVCDRKCDERCAARGKGQTDR